jgi:hypothetical protein
MVAVNADDGRLRAIRTRPDRLPDPEHHLVVGDVGEAIDLTD